MSARPAAFLDRDGVINDVVPDPRTGTDESPLRPEDVRLMPGVAAAMHELSAAGFVLVQVSNQPAAAKGHVPVEQLHAVQARVEELLAADGARFAAAKLCLCHPDGIVEGLSGPCACRKPAPGMLLDAARDLDLDLAASWMFGDGGADVGAARAAGCSIALVEHPRTAHRRRDAGAPDLRAGNLSDAVRLLVGQIR